MNDFPTNSFGAAAHRSTAHPAAMIASTASVEAATASVEATTSTGVTASATMLCEY